MTTLKVSFELDINIPSDEFLLKLQSAILDEFRDEVSDYDLLEYTESPEVVDIDDHWPDWSEFSDDLQEREDFAQDNDLDNWIDWSDYDCA